MLHFCFICVILSKHKNVQHINALVAQLDRVTGYEPVGRGFESLPAYQKRGMFFRMFLVFIMLWKCARILFISGVPTKSKTLWGEEKHTKCLLRFCSAKLFKHGVCFDETHHCTAVFERRNRWSIRYKLTWQFVWIRNMFGLFER